ncbi:unnamed protein product [Meganyctiphanes norvegica]|uniref:c-SKI SMAD4-binding domain-containing protein n=1 Tax=Meganyctiphanes norvegica TaxID=48144 RepID=A0AAV2QMH5_MEGNR
MATSSSQVSDYSPHLKRVLKNYQNSAVNSLHGPGPNNYLVAPAPQDQSQQLLDNKLGTQPLIQPHKKHLSTDIVYIDHGYSKQQLYREGGYNKALIYSEDCNKSKEQDSWPQCAEKDVEPYNIKSWREGTPSGKVGHEELVKVVLPQDLWQRACRGVSVHGPDNKVAPLPSGPADITTVVALVPPPAAAATATNTATGTSSSSGGFAEPPNTSNTSGTSQQQASTVVEAGVSWVEPGHFLAPPPFPPQPWPVFTVPDKEGHGGQAETLLDGEPIACFTVGGEKRLCLPQILNSVLRDFSLTQINAVCSDLQIYCSRCTAEQLDELKSAAVLPSSAMSCGLITNTDAQRLTQTLLATHPANRPPQVPPMPRVKNQLMVYHCCFGKCKGVVWEELYVGPGAPCVECDECHGLFSPERFVTHAHRSLEKRTCHWGFEADNWRTYLLLAKDQTMPMEKAEALLKSLKNKFDPSNHKRKKDGVEAELPKKVRSEDGNLAAAAAAAAHPGVPAYSYDPLVQQYYYRLATSTMPSPWTATPLVTRDGKPLPPPPPAFVRDSFPAPVPAYLSQGPPVLADPGRVVPMSDSQKFERHYQPNVALAPPKVRDKMAREAAQARDTQIEKQALYQSPVIKSENIKKEGGSIYYPSGHSQILSKSPTQKALQRPSSPNIKQNSREGIPPPPSMSAAHTNLSNSSQKFSSPEDIPTRHKNLSNSSQKLCSPEDVTTRHLDLELSTTDSDTDSVSSITQKSETVEEAEALLRGWSDRAAATKVAQLVADLAARLAQRETEANMLRRRLDAHNKEQNQIKSHHQTQLTLTTRTNKEERQLREKVSVLEAELYSLREEFRGPIKQPTVISAPMQAATIKTEPCELGPTDNNC